MCFDSKIAANENCSTLNQEKPLLKNCMMKETNLVHKNVTVNDSKDGWTGTCICPNGNNYKVGMPSLPGSEILCDAESACKGGELTNCSIMRETGGDDY